MLSHEPPSRAPQTGKEMGAPAGTIEAGEMPRRKRGRDKRKSGTQRSRTKKNLFALNTRAAWKVGKPRPDFKADPRPRGGKKWVQLREPFAEERALGESLGFYNIDGRIYLGRPDDRRTGIVL